MSIFRAFGFKRSRSYGYGRKSTKFVKGKGVVRKYGGNYGHLRHVSARRSSEARAHRNRMRSYR